MNFLRPNLALLFGLALVSVPVHVSLGQTSIGSTVKPVERDGRVVVSDQQATDLGLPALTTDAQRLPPEIKERLRKFEVIRETYLKEQASLRKRLTGAATDEERERIRAQIVEARAAWLSQARKLREEAQERLRDLQRLMPDRVEILKNAQEKVRERRGIGNP
jgi:hypothetical protein